MQCCALQRVHAPRRALARAPGVRARCLPRCAAVAESAPSGASLSHALGDFGGLPTALLPALLRLSDVRFASAGTAAGEALAVELPDGRAAAAGAAVWLGALERGGLPTAESFAEAGPASLPLEPLLSRMVTTLAALGVAPFCTGYPALRLTLAQAVCNACVSYAQKRRAQLLGPAEEGEGEGEAQAPAADGSEPALDFKKTPEYLAWQAQQNAAATAARLEAERALEAAGGALLSAGPALPSASAWAGDPRAAELADEVCEALRLEWAPACASLRRAGAAFNGLDTGVVGGSRGAFALADPSWSRKGWAAMEKYRRTLEDCRELRDLVRRLGRGAGWGPLRLSPTQRFDAKARDGLLRDPLEAAETRSLTRGGDIAMMLPAEASLYAAGRRRRVARLLFHARRAERALLSYARDGWAVLPASDVAPWIREVRPTAERGPILLCLDSSGSMRGAREGVAKALALECMRAAKVQERGCYCFAFSGPQQIEEIDLASDPAGLARLFDFLERPFNGGSDLNAPLAACVGRLATAEWANSDILIVSDGELRQPGTPVLRQISIAKDTLGLRIHGLQLPINRVIGHQEGDRDTGVLRQLCACRLRGGKEEVLLQTFASWDALEEDVFAQEELLSAGAVSRGKAREMFREAEALRLQSARRLEEKEAGLSSRDKRLSAHPAGRYDKVTDTQAAK